MKNSILFTLATFATSSLFAANIYITRGYDEAKTGPNKWSDLSIWASAPTDNKFNGQAYNSEETQASALPSATDILIGSQKSGYTGNGSFSGILDVDIEGGVTIGGYSQGSYDSVIDHFTGNSITFQFPSTGGNSTIINQNRNLQGLRFDNDINVNFVANSSGLGTAYIVCKGLGGDSADKRNLVFNGNIKGNTVDGKYGTILFKFDINTRDQWTKTNQANDIIINGSITNATAIYGYDLGKKPTDPLSVGKIYINGTETNNTRWTSVMGGVELVLNKTNGAYALGGGGYRIMIYHGSKLTYMGNQQLEDQVGLQFKTPVSEITGSKIGGQINLNGFNQKSSELHFYNDGQYLSSGVLAVIDFGEDGASIGKDQTFEIGKIHWDAANVWAGEEKGKLILNETFVVFKNFELDGDRIVVREALSDSAKNMIIFDGIGERDVDYEVLFSIDELTGYTNISYNLIPEPSTFAVLFGFGALAFVLIRRKR